MGARALAGFRDLGLFERELDKPAARVGASGELGAVREGCPNHVLVAAHGRFNKFQARLQ